MHKMLFGVSIINFININCSTEKIKFSKNSFKIISSDKIQSKANIKKETISVTKKLKIAMICINISLLSLGTIIETILLSLDFVKYDIGHLAIMKIYNSKFLFHTFPLIDPIFLIMTIVIFLDKKPMTFKKYIIYLCPMLFAIILFITFCCCHLYQIQTIINIIDVFYKQTAYELPTEKKDAELIRKKIQEDDKFESTLSVCQNQIYQHIYKIMRRYNLDEEANKTAQRRIDDLILLRSYVYKSFLHNTCLPISLTIIVSSIIFLTNI